MSVLTDKLEVALSGNEVNVWDFMAYLWLYSKGIWLGKENNLDVNNKRLYKRRQMSVL